MKHVWVGVETARKGAHHEEVAYVFNEIAAAFNAEKQEMGQQQRQHKQPQFLCVPEREAGERNVVCFLVVFHGQSVAAQEHEHGHAVVPVVRQQVDEQVGPAVRYHVHNAVETFGRIEMLVFLHRARELVAEVVEHNHEYRNPLEHENLFDRHPVFVCQCHVIFSWC